MHPVLDELFAGGAFALGHLVFVVGEDEVFAAAMDIKGVAQVFAAHGRAFYVPAGPAGAPGAFPGGFPRLAPFPEGKIHGVFFFFVHRDAGACLHVFQVATGKGAVAAETGNPEVDIGVNLVGESLANEVFDQLDDLPHVFGGLWLDGGREDAEAGHVFVKHGDEAAGKFLAGGVLLLCPLDDLVVDIGEVADKENRIAPVTQIADDHIEDQGGPGMADMAVVIGGDAADVRL